MMVKDEADVIEHVVRHLRAQVNELIVADNGSTDGTREMLDALAGELAFEVRDDPVLAYTQSEKMTRLAEEARLRGHDWVLPCDADEYWYAPDGRPLSAYLAGVAPDVHIVSAELFNHIPTSRDDPDVANPFSRIGWRIRERAPLGKVCVRTHPELVIHAGNHSARLPGAALSVGGLVVRHYSWRSEQQYLRKIVNGARAVAAAQLPDDLCVHWRMFGDAPSDDVVIGHYRTWFYSEEPEGNPNLIFDPAPWVEQGRA